MSHLYGATNTRNRTTFKSYYRSHIQLNIKCDNVERGCPEIMKLEVIEAHIANCGYTAVKCLNDGSEVTIAKNDQLHHENTECTYRKGKCELCGEDVPYAKRKLHCYVMRTEIAEMRDEISSIKDDSEQRSDWPYGIRDWADEPASNESQGTNIDDIKLEMNEIKKEVQSTKQELQTPVHSLGSPSLQNSQCSSEIS